MTCVVRSGASSIIVFNDYRSWLISAVFGFSRVAFHVASCQSCATVRHSSYISRNSFEKYYDPVPVHKWMDENPLFPILTCTIYAIAIFSGQYLMKDSQSWKWRRSMAAWNLFLSVFSGIGMLRTMPQLAHNLATMSLRDNLCLDPRSTYGSGSTGLWVQLFILSKIP